MKSKFIKKENSTRLILLFAGWGMDWRLFAGLDHPGHDIMVIWDYRELKFNWSPLLRYDEICVIAWSMGVFAAAVTMHEILPRVTLRVAINGTLNPIDDRTGIPPAIWAGTINALSPSTLRKFNRRMCTSAAQFADFSERAPKRTITELKEELEALETHTIFHAEAITEWDIAIIGTQDGIFPPQNQQRAWKNVAPVRTVEMGHLPDFDEFITRLIKDKSHVARRFAGATDTYAETATVQREITRRLMDRFDTVFGRGPIVGNIIEVGAGHEGLLTRRWIHRADRRAKLCIWDLNDVNVDDFAPGTCFENCDAEIRIKKYPTESAAFIFSSSTVQWFNSPRDFISQCARVLVPGGYLVLSSFVRGNLKELAGLLGNGLYLPTENDWHRFVSNHFDVLICDTEECRLLLDTPRDVLTHLRHTGVTAVNYGTSGAVLARRLLENYPVDAETGRCPLTYHPIYIIARKPSVG